MKETYCLDVKNYEGRRTVFTYWQRELKAPNRPELREDGILERIKETIENPSFIYQDLEHSDRFAYYRREYKINSRVKYMKLILLDRGQDLFVITAYRPDYVKERGKTTLIYGEDNE